MIQRDIILIPFSRKLCEDVYFDYFVIGFYKVLDQHKNQYLARYNFTKRNGKRDRSDHQNTDYYRDPDEKEQLIEDDEDVVHFSATSGFQIDSFKDNLEYHLGTIKSTLGRFIHFLSFFNSNRSSAKHRNKKLNIGVN